MTDVFVIKGKLSKDRDPQGKHTLTEAEIRAMQLQAQEDKGMMAATRRRKRQGKMPSRVPEAARPCCHHGISGFQNSERVALVIVLKLFVTAVLGIKYEHPKRTE